MDEIWKDVKGYEGLYEVSNLGRVKSYYRKGRILKTPANKRGYPSVSLWKNNSPKHRTVHQLVAVAFLNHSIDGHKIVVDHINGDKTNNRVSNLQLITNRENCTKDLTGCSSDFPGVSWNKLANKWSSSININGKKHYLGLYEEEIDAAIAYQERLRVSNI